MAAVPLRRVSGVLGNAADALDKRHRASSAGGLGRLSSCLSISILSRRRTGLAQVVTNHGDPVADLIHF